MGLRRPPYAFTPQWSNHGSITRDNLRDGIIKNNIMIRHGFIYFSLVSGLGGLSKVSRKCYGDFPEILLRCSLDPPSVLLVCP